MAKAPFDRFLLNKDSAEDLTKILNGLHETMNVQPESLSEISFH